MLSSVLNSKRAVRVNIQIIRTFIRLRQLLASHKKLQEKINKMEQKYDERFKSVFEMMRELMAAPPKSKRQIGFHAAP